MEDKLNLLCGLWGDPSSLPAVWPAVLELAMALVGVLMSAWKGTRGAWRVGGRLARFVGECCGGWFAYSELGRQVLLALDDPDPVFVAPDLVAGPVNVHFEESETDVLAGREGGAAVSVWHLLTPRDRRAVTRKAWKVRRAIEAWGALKVKEIERRAKAAAMRVALEALKAGKGEAFLEGHDEAGNPVRLKAEPCPKAEVPAPACPPGARGDDVAGDRPDVNLACRRNTAK